MARIFWAAPVWDVVMTELPAPEREVILGRVLLLGLFPRMYAIRRINRTFRRHRSFVAGNWRVYYRVMGEDVYIRGLWPARMKQT
ncbi:MAG: hypothetical protein HY046_02710 [Acidobacteria bacterium]|nr:hypothetical protein [Acidobacteriota bacterium]